MLVALNRIILQLKITDVDMIELTQQSEQYPGKAEVLISIPSSTGSFSVSFLFHFLIFLGFLMYFIFNDNHR